MEALSNCQFSRGGWSEGGPESDAAQRDFARFCASFDAILDTSSPSCTRRAVYLLRYFRLIFNPSRYLLRALRRSGSRSSGQTRLHPDPGLNPRNCLFRGYLIRNFVKSNVGPGEHFVSCIGRMERASRLHRSYHRWTVRLKAR